MAVTASLYGAFIDHLAQKRVDLDTDTIKVALVGSGYTPNLNTHATFTDITNEVTGDGYTTGGATLTGVTWTYSGGTWTFDADDTAWSTATVTARYAVLYVDSGTDPLIALVDFGADVSATAAAFTITWAAGGIFTVTV